MIDKLLGLKKGVGYEKANDVSGINANFNRM